MILSRLKMMIDLSYVGPENQPGTAVMRAPDAHEYATPGEQPGGPVHFYVSSDTNNESDDSDDEMEYLPKLSPRFVVKSKSEKGEEGLKLTNQKSESEGLRVGLTPRTRVMKKENPSGRLPRGRISFRTRLVIEGRRKGLKTRSSKVGAGTKPRRMNALRREQKESKVGRKRQAGALKVTKQSS